MQNQNARQPQKGKQSQVPISSTRKPAAGPPKKKPRLKKSFTEVISQADSKAVVIIGMILTTVYMAFLVYRYIKAIWFLAPKVVTSNPFIILLAAGLPFVVWLFSTKYDEFNYHNRKKTLLYICVANAIASVVQLIPYIVSLYLIPKILTIEITENFTRGMVLMLGRMAIVFPTLIAVIIIVIPIKNFFRATEMEEKINAFRITHHIDTRENKENLYDLKIIKDLKTGKDRVIKENDRFIHLFINGASGTGKTSSTISRAVECDLDKKVANKLKREEELLKMVNAGEAIVLGPAREITELNIKPKKSYLEKYREIYKKYPDCGITVMAPNNSLNDDVVALCQARGIKVNVIDPVKVYEELLAKRKGINPFYIPFDLEESDRVEQINDAAGNFSDVIIATNEAAGAGDEYFRGINSAVTTNVAVAVMLANNIQRKQTNISEIQRCIGSFEEIKPYIEKIEEHYGISVQASEISTKTNKNDGATALKNKATSAVHDSGTSNPYYQTIQFIKQELLGAGAEKMYDQSRGLRNLVNEILRNPRFKELLSCPVENSVNFDKILKNNEVTVVNTAIEKGQRMSTAFGLFFLLSFDVAIKRRKKTERSNHFFWIDEAAQYIHPIYDVMITLYRQYRVAVGLAMQSVSQMEKNRSTAYLKSVILGSGTHIVFGRVSAEEMKMYSDLAGTAQQDQLQTSSTSSSTFSSNASQTTQERVTKVQENILEGSAIRQRDFQEVTVFTTESGKVVPPYIGKLRFVKKSAFKDQGIQFVDWSKYVKGKKQPAVLTPQAQKVRNEQSIVLKERRGAVQITETEVKTSGDVMALTKEEDTSTDQFLFSDSLFEDLREEESEQGNPNLVELGQNENNIEED